MLSDIHMLTLSETHLNELSSLLPRIQGYTFIYKNRLNGLFGGVAAVISNQLQWLRRIDVEHPDLECMWIEVLWVI